MLSRSMVTAVLEILLVIMCAGDSGITREALLLKKAAASAERRTQATEVVTRLSSFIGSNRSVLNYLLVSYGRRPRLASSSEAASRWLGSPAYPTKSASHCRFSTYDHTHCRTRDLVRSPIDKPTRRDSFERNLVLLAQFSLWDTTYVSKDHHVFLYSAIQDFGHSLAINEDGMVD